MSKSYEINFEKLHFDMRSKLKTDEINMNEAEKEMNLSRVVFHNVREGLDIRSSTLLKVLKWLGKDLNEYLV